MIRLILHILSNAVGILAAERIISGVTFTGDWKILILAGAVLGLINFFLKPIIKVISAPLIWITLGFFTVVINVFLLNLVAKIIPQLEFATWMAVFWAVIVISVINYLVSSLTRD